MWLLFNNSMAFDWASAVVEGEPLQLKPQEKPETFVTLENAAKGGGGFDWASAEVEEEAFDWSTAEIEEPGGQRDVPSGGSFDWASAVVDESPGRVGEFVARVVRGARQGVQDVKAGLYGLVSEFTGVAENPYRGMGVEQLESKRLELQSALETELDLDARRDDAAYSVNRQVQVLRNRLRQVEDSLSGRVPVAETVQGATADLAEDAQARGAEIGQEYVGRVSPGRDGEFWMKVADSVGGSVPGTGAAMLNPLFGLSMMFAQTYEGAREEFAASERGAADGDEAHGYALKQAALQTPFEVVGDVAFAGVATKALGGLLKGGANPKALGDWIRARAVDLGKATAGEVLVTTPAQTLGEQVMAEAEGVRDVTSAGEKAGQVVEAMKVAAGQSLFMGGGPVAVEGAGRAVTGGFAGAAPDGVPRALDLRAAGEALGGVSVEVDADGVGSDQVQGDERFAPPGDEAAVYFRPANGRTETPIVFPADAEAVTGRGADGLAAYSENEKARNWLFQQPTGSNPQHAWVQLQAAPIIYSDADVVNGVGPEAGQAPPASVSPPEGTGAAPESSRRPDGVKESRGPGSVNPARVKAVQGWVADTVGRWGGNLQVSVHESAETIPDPDLRRSVVDGGGSVEAFFNPADGGIHVLADRVASRGDVERVLRHESMHRAFAGPMRGEYVEILDRVARMVPPDRMEALARAYPNAGPALWLEEYLAYEGQKNPGSPVWREFVYEVKRVLRRVLGDAVEFSNRDVMAFLAKANRRVSRGGGPRSAGAVLFSKVVDEAANDPGKKRGFIRSVEAAAAVLPSVNERVRGVYEPLSNRETVAAARDWVNGLGLDGALVRLLATDRPTARDYAAGIEMMGRLQAGGRFDDAAALAERMAETATGQGQAIQALSLLSKLTQEGVQFYSQRVIRRAVEKNPLLEKLHGEVSRLRGELRKARATMAKSAVVKARVRGGTETVQQRLQRLLVANPGALWGRYKDGAVRELAGKLLGPGRPRMMPALEVFTVRLKKQLREQIKVRAAGRVKAPAELSEAEMIGEAVRNFDKYREVWTEAQAFVADTFRDNPEALQSLDEYLGQILDRPFSERSVERAVRQVLDEMNLKMREVLTQSAGDKERMRRALQGLIVERAGLTGADAAGLAEAIGKEFEGQQNRAREGLLKAMVRTGAVQVPKSRLERLIELNNAGALDDTRFFAVLAKHYGIPAWTPELSAKVQRLQREHEEARDPEVKLVKAAQMFDAVHELVPADAWGRVKAVQNISLLLNTKTMIRNIGGNVVLFAADVPADALSSWVVDPFVSLFTGKRTRRSVDVAQRLSGLAAPVRDVWKGREFAREQGVTGAASLMAGVQHMLTMARLASRGKWDLGQVQQGNSRVLTSAAGKLFEDALSLSLSTFDRSFHQAAFKGSIMRQIRVAEARGEIVVSPTKEMIEEAMMDAARATFMNDNFVSEGLKMGVKAANWFSTVGRTTQYGIGSVVLPFPQVPGNILLRGVEWSPLGFVRAAYEVLRVPVTRGEFQQKEFVDAFSRATLGTAGLSALGFWLFGLGILTALPEEDEDLERMRKDSGLGAYQINASALKRAMLTGNWWTRQKPQADDVVVNYDWVQPLAMPLAMGAAVAQKRERDRLDGLQGKGSGLSGMLGMADAAGKAAVRTLEDQPLLMGLKRAMGDVGRHGGWGVLMQVLDAPAQFIPTFVRQVGQLMDNQVRETRAGGPWDQAVNRLLASIPGLSQKYPQRYDVFGEAQERYGYGGNSFFNVMLNPAFVKRVRVDPALREMEAVYAATGDGGVLPRRAPVKLALAGERVELTNEQIAQYQQLAGQLTVRAYTKLAASPQFAELPAGQKAEVAGKLMRAINGVVKLLVVRGNPDVADRLRGKLQERERARAALME